MSEEQEPWLCALCIEAFLTAGELEEHIEKAHQKELFG
jgi:hypothetical protein